MRFAFFVVTAFFVSACGLFLDTDPPPGDHDAAVTYDDATVDAAPNGNR